MLFKTVMNAMVVRVSTKAQHYNILITRQNITDHMAWSGGGWQLSIEGKAMASHTPWLVFSIVTPTLLRS